eukprot:RCo046952
MQRESPMEDSCAASELSPRSSCATARGLKLTLQGRPLPALTSMHSDTVPDSPTPSRRRRRYLPHNGTQNLTSPGDFPTTPMGASTCGGVVPVSTPWCSRVKVPLRVIFVVVLCVFSVGPALTLWVVSWCTGQDALNGVQSLAMSAVEGVSAQLQDSLITSVQTSLVGYADRSEVAINEMGTCLETSGVLDQDGATSQMSPDAVTQFQDLVFSIVKNNPWMFMLNLSLFSDLHNGSAVMQSVVFGWSSMNYVTQQIVPTLYSTPKAINAFHNATVGSLFVASVTTGQPMTCLDAFIFPYRTPAPMVLSEHPTCQMDNTISFLPVVGVPFASLECVMPFTDRRAAFTIKISTNMYSVSKLLLSLVPTDKDRLFLILRTVQGTMVGASHGKFFSHSNIDFSQNNPFTNPPPIAQFQLYSAVNSTDTTIRTAAWWLLDSYLNWAQIPEVSASLELDGNTFWIRSVYISSQQGLKWQVFLLIDAESRVGPVQAKNHQAARMIRHTNILLVCLLVGVVAAAFACAVGIALLLSLPLERLAKGMGLLAVLELEGRARTEERGVGKKGRSRGWPDH